MLEGGQQGLKIGSVLTVSGHFCGSRVHSGVVVANECGLFSVGEEV